MTQQNKTNKQTKMKEKPTKLKPDITAPLFIYFVTILAQAKNAILQKSPKNPALDHF